MQQIVIDIAAQLVQRKAFLATAESCTGGLIAAQLTALAGSSQWFERGVVTYSNAAKIELLGVAPELIATHGAVSEPVALAMAKGVALNARVDYALSVTGIAGPGGGSLEKPVGTVCFGFYVCGELKSITQHFDGNREQVRAAAVAFALQTLLQKLKA